MFVITENIMKCAVQIRRQSSSHSLGSWSEQRIRWSISKQNDKNKERKEHI